MTVEELEILVEAKIEPAIKEIKKLMPQIRQTVSQATETANKAMQKVNTEQVQGKIKQTTKKIKKHIDDLKKSTESNKIAININNKDAEKQISQLEKEIDSLQKKITARQMKLAPITERLDIIQEQKTKEYTPDGVSSDNPAIQNTIQSALQANTEFRNLSAQEDKIIAEIKQYNQQLDLAKAKIAGIKQETKDGASYQNRWSGYAQKFNGIMKQAGDAFNKLINGTKKVTNGFKTVINKVREVRDKLKDTFGGNHMSGGIRSVLKYAGALFSLRSIYNTLGQSANSWLSSQNAQAKQLSANIEYMKYAMGSAFAPVIEYIVNLVYKLMKAIQQVIYMFSGINIFAKATASSMNSTAKSAKKAAQETRQLAGFDEINNLTDDKSSDNGSGGGDVSPNMDLSSIDSQMSEFAQKLYDFFKPLKESWDKYGPELVEQIKTTASQIGYLISSVWSSFEKIITNGTVYKTLELILAIIGDIAEAFANAWNYNGNGDAIVQNLADAFNNLLTAIHNVVDSKGFQDWLNLVSTKFREITEVLAKINWQPIIDALAVIGGTVGVIALDVLKMITDTIKTLTDNAQFMEGLKGLLDGVKNAFEGIQAVLQPVIDGFIEIMSPILAIVESAVGDIFNKIGDALKKISENETAVEILKAVGGALAIIVAAIAAWEIAQIALNVVIGIFEALTSPVTLVILAVVAAITAIILVIKNWGAITEWMGNLWSTITTKIKEIVENMKKAIGEKIEAIKTAIKDKFNKAKETAINIFNTIKDKIKEKINTLKTNITTIVTKIKTGIVNGFTNAKNKAISVFNTLKTKMKNIFTSIWNFVKKPINSILGGIEKMANGVINGINAMTRGLNKLKFNVPDWVPVLGGKSFGFNIGTIGNVKLPRLATGNVAYKEMVGVFGEYAGASSNPEITAPQSILRETFEDVMSDFATNNNKNEGAIKQLVIQFGSYRVANEMENLLRKAQRMNGTATVTV